MTDHELMHDYEVCHDVMRNWKIAWINRVPFCTVHTLCHVPNSNSKVVCGKHQCSIWKKKHFGPFAARYFLRYRQRNITLALLFCINYDHYGYIVGLLKIIWWSDSQAQVNLGEGSVFFSKLQSLKWWNLDPCKWFTICPRANNRLNSCFKKWVKMAFSIPTTLRRMLHLKVW